ncbi:hypothetical protein [Rhodovulum euryhalinum]|uniref:Dynamin family protein n=1 Tax=Rhodovulum euryhalinum TaxID=35805 RepID=A0A4R2KSL5_9RHOB|nr:hypothetical protein [Rhodovulum euryhalinum]TCO74016.1 hypothetical protein EV655_101173 [Rhodovulum euryhalinum]
MNAIFERDTLARLDRAVASGHLPERVRAHGQRLLDRLRKPVRLVVTGPAGSGKSDLVHLLAGDRGPATRPSRGGPPVETLSTLLGNLVVVDLDLPAAADAIGRAVAIEETAPDILLWCTQGFTHDEAKVWSRVPDNLKDHAFLVLTKADDLMRLGVLDERLDDLRDVVEVEFHSLLPIATRQAAAAREGNRVVDAALHARSGAAALFEALDRMIEQGRSADLDAASLFLRRHDLPSDAILAEPAEAVAAKVPQPEPDLSQRAQAPAPLPQSHPTPPAPPVPQAEVAVSAQALHLLDACRGDFPDEIGANDPAAVSALLSLCARTAESLSEIVEGAGVAGDLAEDVLEANEMLLLLGLEGDENAAADAVTLLLQLRRGFDARLAA